jgi:predicted nucleotidyltransferase
VKPLFGLDNSTIAKICDVLRRYHEIEKAVIYGSRAKGNYREGSDIDLTLFGNVSTKTVAEVLDALDESFLPYTFDISAYDSLKNDKLREHIDRVGKGFYRRESDSGAGARKGWEQKKLGEVAKASYGYTESASYKEIGPKFLRITDLQNGGVDWKTVFFLGELFHHHLYTQQKPLFRYNK